MRDEHEYREHAPPAPCRAQIDALRSRAWSGSAREHVVLPDSVDILIVDLAQFQRAAESP